MNTSVAEYMEEYGLSKADAEELVRLDSQRNAELLAYFQEQLRKIKL